MYFNILCIFSWNKKEGLTAKMHGAESFKCTYVRTFSLYYGKTLNITHCGMFRYAVCH